MNGDFAGSRAEAYRRFRRDVPTAVLEQLVTHVGLDGTDRAVDLGAGTGQVAVPLAARLAGVLALEPEPDMLVQLRQRAEAEQVENLVCVLAADSDLPALADTAGEGGFGLLTVANALHWMDATEVFAAARRLLRPGGAVAVITHGRPLWLGERDWTRALRAYLEDWFGPLTGTCGTDEPTRAERRRLLEQAGFTDITVLEQHLQAPLDADYVVGHLYSALAADRIAADRREAFAAGARAVLRPFADRRAGALVEEVPVDVLVGRQPGSRWPGVQGSAHAAALPAAGVTGPPMLRGRRVVLVPVTAEHVPELRRILATPEVRASWLDEDASPQWPFDDDSATRFAVLLEHAVRGMVQYFEEDDPDYRHASIDIFLDPAVHGRGIGRDAVATLAHHLVHDRGHHRLVIDPAADNQPAIRCYSAVGFRPVGIMRGYERDAGGVGWHDGLLMDLLAKELPHVTERRAPLPRDTAPVPSARFHSR